MSRYWDDPEVVERRIYRGLVVQEFGDNDVDLLEYIRIAKGLE
jgi:hypothetical protein